MSVSTFSVAVSFATEKALKSRAAPPFCYLKRAKQLRYRLSWLLFLLVILLAIATPFDSYAETRIAFLISNWKYAEASSSLSNSSSDAISLGDELRRDGFEVDVKENLKKQDMQTAIEQFKSKVKAGTTALFFFSGIGLEYKRQSYIIPINAEIWKEADIKRDGVNLDSLLSDLAANAAGVKIVIIDAARRNPFERNFREDGSRGLAAIDAPPGSLIMLSATPGKLVPDNAAESGRFVNELLRQIRQPGSAEDTFNRTRLGVYNKSRGEQVPWVSSSLLGEFSFASGGPAATSQETAPKAPPTRQAQAEIAASPAKPAVAVTPGSVVASASSPAGFTFRDCEGCPELVVVPGGSFTMGSSEAPSEMPHHTVKIPHAFAIGRFEVTFAEWDRCVEAGDCRYQPGDHGWGRARIPVADVSWEDANAYLNWLSHKTGETYRLPSEAEWEFAARGGTSSRFWWGHDQGTENANCTGCGPQSQGKPIAVGSFKPNAFGLYDTSGNVAEWVQDCWNESYKGAPGDGSSWLAGNCGLRVLRGGSFGSKAQYVRSPARFRYDSDVRYLANGFRVLRELR